jgi:AcrR family transcriptional regulator
LRTTFDLLVEKGMSGASVDEVASRSGVAKTTIYRHWRTRSDLIFEACSLVSSSLATPDTGSLERDLTVLLLGLATQLRNANWPLVLPSVVDASERDPELAAALAQRQRNQSAPYYTVIERAKSRGEFAADADASRLVASLVGPVFYRRWFSRERIDEDFVNEVVRGVIHGGES